jgi:hypothetical protein
MTITHPRVCEHYADMMAALMREVPDLGFLSVWTNDSGAGFEHTKSLYVGRNGGAYMIREWKDDAEIAKTAGTHAVRFFGLLRDAARAVNPEFRVITRLESFYGEHDTVWAGLGDGLEATTARQHLAMSCGQMGDFEAAARRAHELLHRSGTSLSSKTRAIILLFHGGALSALGRLAEAEESLRVAVPQARHGWGSAASPLAYATYLLASQHRVRDAARIAGYIEATQSTVVLPSARRFCDSANALIAGAMEVEELDRLHAEGRRLTGDEAIALAFPPRP